MKGPTGIVSIRLRMNFISLSPIYKLYQNSSEQAVLSDRCSTLNPAFSNMTSTNKMIMNENRDSKYLGYYTIYALNISHSALQSAVYSSVLSFDSRAILASTVNIAHIHVYHLASTHIHTQTQTTARLKLLLTEAGITFTSHAFNTEDGIEGLGLQPFVSFYIYCSCRLYACV